MGDRDAAPTARFFSSAPPVLGNLGEVGATLSPSLSSDRGHTCNRLWLQLQHAVSER